jgi:2-hydroxy-6-oxonona-2,4-dienedioate hydrolase/4,5:9,10-diseco-3-hydroxy-5,9,17-trioxoandrosta-1(10),2-diene-4-oate hydrolase
MTANQPTPPEGRFVTANGVRVYCQELGEGDPILFLHGGGPGASGWGNFQRNLAHFAQGYRAIVVDFPGFGRSDTKPREAPLVEFYAETILSLLDELGISSAHFVGNSMGGLVSLKLALDQPNRVNKLVLMGTGGGYPVLTPFPTLALKILFTFYEPPGPSLERLKTFVNECVYDPRSIPEGLYEERLLASLDPRIVENPPLRMHGPPSATGELWRDRRLTSLPHDTLIVWGREDRVMPLDASLVLLQQIPAASLHVIPKCGHWAMWERADEFNALVSLFLSRPA